VKQENKEHVKDTSTSNKVKGHCTPTCWH